MDNIITAFNSLQGLPATADEMPAPAETAEISTDLLHPLRQMGLLAAVEAAGIVPLAGGVSSEIYRVDLAGGPVCVKRALPKLRVSSEWLAPVERSDYEREWLKLARAVVGEAVPEVVGEVPGMFAMEYLDPRQYPVWKEQLRDGQIDPSTAAEVGRLLGRIHAATSNNMAVAQRFDTDDIFHSIRLEPYLHASARVQSELAARLHQIAEITARTKLALVHGDVSPKNVLVGQKGPVLLDAECAWYGDPAFDVAFLLNHLLLKCIWRPRWCGRYLHCFDAFCASYLQRVNWERPEELEQRAASLLPALALARVCGKSPVEYIRRTEDADKVVAIARQLLLAPVVRLAAVRETWRVALLQ